MGQVKMNSGDRAPPAFRTCSETVSPRPIFLPAFLAIELFSRSRLVVCGLLRLSFDEYLGARVEALPFDDELLALHFGCEDARAGQVGLVAGQREVWAAGTAVGIPHAPCGDDATIGLKRDGVGNIGG